MMKMVRKVLGFALCLGVLVGAAVGVSALLRTPAMAADSVIPAVTLWDQQTRSTEYGKSIATQGTQSTDWSSDKYVYTGTWYRCEDLNKKNSTAVGELVIENGKVQLYYIPNDLEVGVYYYYLKVTAKDKSGNTVETGTSPVNTVTVNPSTPKISEWPKVASLKCGQKLGESTITGGTMLNQYTNVKVEGTFVWKDGDTVLTKTGTSRYKLVFKPTDTHNYKDYELSPDVTVSCSGTNYSNPTCTQPGKCLICGTIVVRKRGHDYTVWDHDDDQHWMKCSRCDEIDESKKTAHVYKDVVDAKYLVSEATCTAKATYYKSCECGAVSTATFESGETNPNNHSGSLGIWQSDENNHWQEWDCCHVRDKDSKGAHDWDDGKVTEEPTCTKPGEKTFTCSVCKKEKTEDIDATGHSYGTPSYTWNGTSCTATRVCTNDATHVDSETVDAVVTVTQPQSCTSKELSTYTARFKNTEFATQTKTNVETKPALDHDLIHHEAKAATCTEIGWDAYDTCNRCNYTTYKELPALNHDYVHHEAKAATCTEIGWEAYNTCSRCDYSTYKELPALDHDLIHHEAKAATCTEIGWEAYDTCSRCDYTTYKEIPALDHDLIHHEAKAATCTEIGWEAYDTCSRCDYTTYKEIPALDHDLIHHEAKAATCTEIGWEAYDTCSRCDYTTYKEIPATGHTWTPATCTVPKTCSVCSATEGSAMGHDWGE